MSSNQWPWNAEEVAVWEKQLSEQEFGWIDELIDRMVRESLAGSSYDPVQADQKQEENAVLEST
jgi:hypothetical protein